MIKTEIKEKKAHTSKTYQSYSTPPISPRGQSTSDSTSPRGQSTSDSTSPRFFPSSKISPTKLESSSATVGYGTLDRRDTSSGKPKNGKK